MLTYQALQEMETSPYYLKEAPERILQFGTGNFLRGFVGDFVDQMNEQIGYNTKIVMCKLIPSGGSHSINAQEGLYTLYTRGYEKGVAVEKQRILSAVSRCIDPYADFDSLLRVAQNPLLEIVVSNATEAGIVYDVSCSFNDQPPASFPAKLTRFLYERYSYFEGDSTKGLCMLPCELIDDNGVQLKHYVKKHSQAWQLGEDFEKWLDEANVFCNTLVDRIVTGYPKKEKERLETTWGYQDTQIVATECYALWVIESFKPLRGLPFEKTTLPIRQTTDYKPYKERKVRLLNGAHTSFVLGAYLSGQNNVRESLEDPVIEENLRQTLENEIIPAMQGDRQAHQAFMLDVIERFKNPFIDHQLLDIALNTTAKLKARILPSLLDYDKRFGKLPEHLVAAFAYYVVFYKDLCQDENGYFGQREGERYKIVDAQEVLAFYRQHQGEKTADLIHELCQRVDFWEMDLSSIPNFEQLLHAQVCCIEAKGIRFFMIQLMTFK